MKIKLLALACLITGSIRPLPVAHALQLGSTGGASGLNVSNASGILPSTKGGTGINNAGTITNASNTTITGGGTLGLGGFTLTVPQTDTAAVLGRVQTFSQPQTISAASGTPLTMIGTSAATNTNSIFSTVAGNQAGILLQDGGISKFQLAKHADNSFILYDYFNARTAYQYTVSAPGTHTFTGAAAISSTLSVTGATTLTGTTAINNTATVAAATNILFASNLSSNIGSTTAGAANIFAQNYKGPAGNFVVVTTVSPVVAAASQAGPETDLIAADATAGNVTAGAASGGAIVISSGNAQRLTSGNAAGGQISITTGTGIGTGRGGDISINPAASGVILLGNPTTTADLAAVYAAPTGTVTGTKSLVVQAHASQTANQQEWQTSAGVANSSVDPTGAILTIGNSGVTTGQIKLANAGAASFKSIVQSAAIATADRTITIPDAKANANFALVGSTTAGTATLVAGTVTVSTTAVAAASVILISRNAAGGTTGDLRLGAITAGTSFIINSASGTDTSTVNWWLVN